MGNGRPRAVDPQAPSPGRWARPPLARAARCAQRHPLDPQDWRSLARPAPALPELGPHGSARPAAVMLVGPLLEARFTPAPPERLVGDRTVHSDPLDQELAT